MLYFSNSLYYLDSTEAVRGIAYVFPGRRSCQGSGRQVWIHLSWIHHDYLWFPIQVSEKTICNILSWHGFSSLPRRLKATVRGWSPLLLRHQLVLNWYLVPGNSRALRQGFYVFCRMFTGMGSTRSSGSLTIRLPVSSAVLVLFSPSWRWNYPMSGDTVLTTCCAWTGVRGYSPDWMSFPGWHGLPPTLTGSPAIWTGVF